jgi:NAD(P)-dependent dehydrogenase (short-subunit alcohol dehydrogenase family)
MCIANGRTPALEGILTSPQNFGYDAIQEMLRQTPCERRLAEPEEIAYAVGMLCGDRARWMNGTFIHVNGGLFID